jgi:hypothetical protein
VRVLMDRNPKQLTFGGKGFIPAPSPDGRWVYYKSWLDDRGGLCRVPIDGDGPECFSDKETTWVSFSPDGEYFAASYIRACLLSPLKVSL